MELHYATLWEALADAHGDREALVAGSTRRTWTQYEQRAARVAAALGAAGLGPDSKVGLYLYNGNEYLEAQFGAFKGRHVPININYRYLDEELLYLLENSDAEALLFHASLAERVERVRDKASKVKLWVQVDDAGSELLPGAVRYEELLAAHDPAPRIRREESDLYMLYTGGTTGMPKGVMYDMGSMVQGFIALAFPAYGLPIPQVHEIPEISRGMWEEQGGLTSIPACPLMHGTGMWLGAMMPHCAGARVVTLTERSFDAHELWRTSQAEGATQLVIVGDAFARPMLRALEEARDRGEPYDLQSLRMIISSGVMWTAEVKQQLLDWHPFVLIDAMGSSEGSMGTQVTTRGNIGQTARFTMNPTTRVFTADGRQVEPGSGEPGMVAAGGLVPVGYYKDEAKSAATFRTIDGVRYSVPGDFARIEENNQVTLLGRGSNCINTAGEKVYPEEVEEAVKRHPDVVDCLVVGVDDEKFGQRVCAVASLQPGSDLDGDTLRDFARSKLAAYKVPKEIRIVDEVRRAPNGKADYPWARTLFA